MSTKLIKYILMLLLTLSICFNIYFLLQQDFLPGEKELTDKDTVSILKIIVEDLVLNKYNHKRLDTNDYIFITKFPFITKDYDIETFFGNMYFSNRPIVSTAKNEFCFLQLDIQQNNAQISYSLSGWAIGYVELKKDKNWKITRHVINDL